MSTSGWILLIAIIIGIILVIVFFFFVGGCKSCKEGFTVLNNSAFVNPVYGYSSYSSYDKPYLTCSPFTPDFPCCAEIIPEQRAGRCPKLLRCKGYNFHDYGFGTPLVQSCGGRCYRVC